MFDKVSRTASYFYEYYCSGLASWWKNMGPNDYIVILCLSLFLGYILLRNSQKHTY